MFVEIEIYYDYNFVVIVLLIFWREQRRSSHLVCDVKVLGGVDTERGAVIRPH